MASGNTAHEWAGTDVLVMGAFIVLGAYIIGS